MYLSSKVFCRCCTFQQLFGHYGRHSRYKQMEPNISEAATVVQSANDKLQYRIIELPNGLTALLISDLDRSESEQGGGNVDDMEVANSDSGHASDEENSEDEDTSGDDDESDETDSEQEEDVADPFVKQRKEKMAAAALCIGVGSFSDPDDLPGLAHYLEHMVFMGSQKYPDENSFDSFVNKHGGSDNAYTDCEQTVFKMEVNTKHFHEALDRFAQFFISPLMKKDSMKRELEAVDSEFQLNLPLDSCRRMQLFGSFARNGHPMGKFMWGNTQTLKTTPEENGIDVYARLRQFYQRHYSAHYMTLAIESRESLDTLEKWTREIFADIPCNSLPKPIFSDTVEPFNTPKFHKLYKIVPVKKIHQVVISWALPSQHEHYRVKPLHYIGWLMGHEGKGSILAYLRKRVWALSLCAGNDESGFEHNSTYALFSMSVLLTEKGMDHVYEVITAILQYLAMLRLEGPQKSLYEEMQVIADNEFKWLEMMDPLDYVEALAENMQRYRPEDFITGDQLMMEYDEKVIRECQDRLIPELAMNVMILSSSFQKEDEAMEREPWTQTPYCIQDIPEEWDTTWKDLRPNPELHLPPPNNFIATDFTIKEAGATYNEYPVKLTEDGQSRIWYKKDSKFNVPKACIYLHLLSPICRSSPQNAVLMDLFIELMYQDLNEDAYAASLASLAYSIYRDEVGLIVKLDGFNHKLPLLLDVVINNIAGFEVVDERFEGLKKYLLKAYYNAFIKPGKLCKDVRLSILEHVHWTSIDKRALVSSVTKDMLQGFVQQFISNMYIEGLIQGNVTEAEAREIDSMVRQKLKCSPLLPDMIPELRVMEMPEGEHFCRVASFNSDDRNSVVTNYYQSGPGDTKKFCLMELLVSYMEEPCFDALRTREQLGYDVSCMFRNTSGILGFTVTVHSPADKYSCSFIDERIESFLQDFARTVAKMSQEEFVDQVTSLIKLKNCADLFLKEEADRNWNEIVTFNYLFDRLSKESNCLSQITLEELKSWAQNHLPNLDERRYRKLGIQVVGNGEAAISECKPCTLNPFIPKNCTQHPRPSAKGGRGSRRCSEVFNHHGHWMHQQTHQKLRSPDALETQQDEGVYTLQFLTPKDNGRDSQFITDVASFKQRLMIYPVTRLLP